MNSSSHEKDFKWSLLLAIFNNKEVCGDTFSRDNIHTFVIIN